MKQPTDGNEPAFKVILCGDVAVGKSNIMNRYLNRDAYRPLSQATMGPGYGCQIVDVNGQRVKANIWDTAGQDTFRAITQIYYRGASAAVLVYDVTRADSFANIGDWYSDILRGCQAGRDEPITIVLLGNKIDLVNHPELGVQREVPTEQAQEYARANGMLFFECSAYEDTNIVVAFEALMTAVVTAAASRQVPSSNMPTLRCPYCTAPRVLGISSLIPSCHSRDFPPHLPIISHTHHPHQSPPPQ